MTAIQPELRKKKKFERLTDTQLLTIISGGVGNVIGSFFGSMILGTLQKIIWFSGLQEAYWQDMANGVMLGIFIVMQSVVLSARGKGKMRPPEWIKISRKNI